MTPPDSAPSSSIPAFPTPDSIGGSPLYVTGEDALACTVHNAAAAVTVTITGRVLLFGQCRPTPFQQTLTPATDRSASVVRFQIGEGWLLNAQVLVTSGTPATGQTFARLSLVHGLTAAAVELFTIAADYITAKLPLSYPGSGVTKSTDGAGAVRSITGATPAAGAEISETVPTGARWELLSFDTQFVTSATVANRQSGLLLDDGANQYALIALQAFSTATQINRLVWGLGIGNSQPINATFQSTSLPVNQRLVGGHRIRTTTANIQVGDQYSAVQYLVREWIEGA
jgi:hypothetical protein